jgi:LacI family transcriptional regulator
MLAEYVGVSPAAVSTVLANRHAERRLAASTVERIRRAVRDLGYIPNVAARRLRAHDPGVRQMELGILTSFEAPLLLVSRVLREVQRAADARSGQDRRFSVSIDIFHAGCLHELPGLLSASRYNGVIITNTLPADDAFLRSTTLPYAVVVQGRRIANYCCVLETPGEGGRRAAEILMKSGRKKPIVLVPPLLTETTADRATAFCAAFRERGLGEPARLAAPGFLPGKGAEGVSAYLRSEPDCDGIFAVTDTLALGAYRAIHASGRRVGGQIGVVGVGDSDNAEFFEPPLTCVGPPYDVVVEEIVALLFDLMSRRRVRPVEVLIPPAGEIRGSA